MESKNPLLSIIITSYTMDRFKDICELLDSIKSQTILSQTVDSGRLAVNPPDPQTLNHQLSDYQLPTLELIFVAERSQELYQKVREFISQQSAVASLRSPIPDSLTLDSGLLTYRLLFNDGEPGLSAARNLGIMNANGDIIGFVDDDVVLFPDWAEEMVKTYKHDSVIGVTGPALPLWEGKSADWFPAELDWIIGCSSWCNWYKTREVRNVWGMNMSFKREAFDLSGLFLTHLGAKGGHETGKHELVGEETEFSIRVKRKTGKNILYNPNVRVWHRVYHFRVTPVVIARRAYWEGYTKAMFSRIYRDKDSSKKMLHVEYELLWRILTKLLPSILKTFFANPLIAWRRLLVTITALFFVTLGYHSHLLNPFNRQKIKLGGNR